MLLLEDTVFSGCIVMYFVKHFKDYFFFRWKRIKLFFFFNKLFYFINFL